MNQMIEDNAEKEMKYRDNRNEILDQYEESEEKTDIIFMVEEIEAYIPSIH